MERISSENILKCGIYTAIHSVQVYVFVELLNSYAERFLFVWCDATKMSDSVFVCKFVWGFNQSDIM